MQKYVIEGTSIPNYSDTVKIDILEYLTTCLVVYYKCCDSEK